MIARANVVIISETGLGDGLSCRKGFFLFDFFVAGFFKLALAN